MSEPTSSQVVTFRVGDDEFAADIMAVERVLRYMQPTPVPNLPDWVEGVLEHQGRVVPVIDLSRRFGVVPERALSGRASDAGVGRRIIIFVVGDEWIGAVVDAVLEVVVIPPELVTPPPELFRGLSAEYLRGLVRRKAPPEGTQSRATRSGLLIFLEVQRLLSATERLVLERAVRESPAGGAGVGVGDDDAGDAMTGRHV
jgi:purine-binding chemotaxis protein CheW